MTSTGSNTLQFATTNGLSNLSLTELTTDDLIVTNFDATNMNADFFNIRRIEVDELLVDSEIELADNAHIVLKKGTINEVILSDNDLLFLDHMTSNIQDQIDDNVTDIATNVTNIATNVNNIATNVTNIATNVTNIATNATNIATNVTNIATNATNIAANVVNITNNAGNINSNELDILALQLTCQYMTSVATPPQTNFQGIISITGGANWSVSHSALRINTIGLDGIVMNPGGNKVVDLHSNIVRVGRTTCDLQIMGSGKITLNSEIQNSAFTNTRRDMILTNQSNIATSVTNIATNATNIGTLQGQMTTAQGNITTNANDITDIREVTDQFMQTASDLVLNTQYNDFRIEAPNIVVGTGLYPAVLVVNGIQQHKGFRNADFDKIYENEGKIIGLETKTEFMSVGVLKTRFTQPVFFNSAEEGKLSIASNLFSIESTTSSGINISPGASNNIDLNSTTVTLGRVNNNVLTIKGTGSQINMNSETQNFCFTNARKDQIATNATNIATNATNITTNTTNITTNTAAILANTTYITNSPFTFNTTPSIFTELDQPLEITGSLTCDNLIITPGGEFATFKANGDPIHSISNTADDTTIGNQAGGFMFLETTGLGKVYINGVDLDNALVQLVSVMADRVLLMADRNKAKIDFQYNYDASMTLGANLIDSTTNGSSTNFNDYNFGAELSSNTAYWNSGTDRIESNFGTIALEVNVTYNHSALLNAFVHQLAFQIRIVTVGGVLRYESPLNGHRSNNNGAISFSRFSVSDTFNIVYKDVFHDCNIFLRTWWWIQTPSATNSVNTSIRMTSVHH